MKKLRILPLVLLIVLVGISTPAMSQMSQGGHGVSAGHGMGGYKASSWKDTLTDEQKAKIAQMKRGFKKLIYPIKAQLKVKKVELAQLVIKHDTTQAEVEKKIDEILLLKKEKMKYKAAFKISVREELTPPQKDLFDGEVLEKAYHGWTHASSKGHR